MKNSNQIGDAMLTVARSSIFGETSLGEWAERLTELISSQPEVGKDVSVSNVRPVGTAAGGSSGTLLFDASYLVTHEATHKKLVLRFVPLKGLFHRYDVAGQYKIQKALEATDVPVPPQLWLDETGEFLKRPGYVMEHVDGMSPPMMWMTSGIIAEASEERRREMCLEYVRTQARIHATDWRTMGLHWLEERGQGTRPMQREISWYDDALVWTGVEQYVESLAPVREWLIANEPEDIETVLCHGDANFGNYMYANGQIAAVVDWEMAFLGAPESDVSFLKVSGDVLLGGATPPQGVPSHSELRDEYERCSGRALRYMDYFELFTAYRLAVIGVLAMKGVPEEMREAVMPTLERGPAYCLELAGDHGVL